MQTADWQKVKEIFSAALEVEAARRADFVSNACAGNEELKKEVDSLLASHEAAGEIYDTPAAEIISGAVADETTVFNEWQPERVGNYRIIREIGRGGMGAVFLAARDDDQFQKQVAVKIIKSHFFGGEVFRRFRQERQILAALEHPNIARLIDGGSTAEGLPFLVMEFVDGESLHEFCERRELLLDERLKIFLEICAAVAYAHRNLVVHRDLKPSNVLVTEAGAPKLLDFGIAKLMDDDDNQTKTDFRAMTPAYASPEQKRGAAVTTATDVYSLGVILAELISRHPQVLGGSPRSVNSQVETLPDKRLTAGGGRGTTGGERRTANGKQAKNPDLQAIVDKSLREEPDRRYSSVEAFADDVRRFLDNLPVAARQGNFAYRVEKFVRRNRALAAAAALVIVAVTGGAAATLWQANAARRQARIAAEERDRAQTAQTRAEKINDFLQKMLGAAAPKNAGREVKVVAVLENAEQQARTELAAQPEILAAVLATVGNTYNNLAQHDAAERNLRDALALYRPLTDRQSEIAAAETAGNLADVLLNVNRQDEAETFARQAIESQRRHQPDTSRDLAVNLIQLGRAMIKKGDAAAAEPFLTEGAEIARRVEGEESEVNLFALNNLATIRRSAGDIPGEIAIYRQIIPILRRKPEAKSNLGISLVNLGATLIETNELDEADRLLTEGLNMNRENFGAENIYFSGASYHLARLRLRQNRPAEAREAAETALKIQQKILPPEHPFIARTFAVIKEATDK